MADHSASEANSVASSVLHGARSDNDLGPDDDSDDFALDLIRAHGLGPSPDLRAFIRANPDAARGAIMRFGFGAVSRCLGPGEPRPALGGLGARLAAARSGSGCSTPTPVGGPPYDFGGAM